MMGVCQKRLLNFQREVEDTVDHGTNYWTSTSLIDTEHAWRSRSWRIIVRIGSDLIGNW
jgi:hypothetical protein